MRKSWAALLIVSLLTLGGCAWRTPVSSDAPQAPSTAEDTTMDEEELPEDEGLPEDAGLPEAVPAFSAHFTDPLYDDPADEFAPFGSDEGYDLLYEMAEYRDEFGPSSTVADVLGDDVYDEFVALLDAEEPSEIPVPGGQVDAATFLIAAGFSLLRLTGHIDGAGREQVLKALDVLIRRYESPEQLLRQKTDLESWTEPQVGQESSPTAEPTGSAAGHPQVGT